MLSVDVSVLVASVVAGFYRMDLFRKSGVQVENQIVMENQIVEWVNL